MIKGALLLGVGFTLGYAKAVRDNDEIAALLRDFLDELRQYPDERPSSESYEEAVVRELERRKTEEDETPEAVEIPEDTDIPTPDREQQGE